MAVNGTCIPPDLGQGFCELFQCSEFNVGARFKGYSFRMKFVMENGATWPVEVCRAAARRGSLKC